MIYLVIIVFFWYIYLWIVFLFGVFIYIDIISILNCLYKCIILYVIFFFVGLFIIWDMVNEYMKIVLLKGLEYINDYYFNVVKFLLVYDLGLIIKM